jgi:hypothetical protein
VQTPHETSTRAASREVLTNATNRLLNDLQTGKLESSREIYADELEPKLRAFHSAHPNTSNAELARILADRFSEQATAYAAARRVAIEVSEESLKSEAKKVDHDVEAYNNEAQAGSSTDSDEAAFAAKKQELEHRKDDLENKFKALKKAAEEDPVNSIRATLAGIAAGDQDLEPIREAYVKNIPSSSANSIKTPSIVVSWAGTHLLASTGGHNLDAQTLHLQMTSDVAGVNLKRTEDGYVLQYNPSKAGEAEEQATALAHAIEHDNVRRLDELNKILNVRADVRSPAAALEIPRSTAADPTWARWSGHLGPKEYVGKSAFVGDLQAVAEKNECCIFVAHDDQEVAYVTERNPSPPPQIIMLEVRDTPSLVEYLKKVSKK